MQNPVMLYQYEGREVRTVIEDGQPYWIAKDICDVLELSNSRKALGRLDDDQKGVTLSDTPGGVQEMATVNESGLYELIIRSDKPQAKAFRKWVTSEVLPSIRRTGGYSAERGVSDEVRMERMEQRVGVLASAMTALIAEAQGHRKVLEELIAAKDGHLAYQRRQIKQLRRENSKLKRGQWRR